jgi:four helix bundle protein
MLLGFRQSTGNQVREEPLPYESGPDSGNRIFFDHERLDVYRKALDLVRWCDRLEKSGCVVRSEATVLDKTSTGVVLNIAEGNGKFSGKDRGRFIGHARTSALQAAATLDIFATRHVDQAKNILDGKTLLVDCVRMLVAWQQSIEES